MSYPNTLDVYAVCAAVFTYSKAEGKHVSGFILSYILCHVLVKLAGQATKTLDVCEVSTSLLWIMLYYFFIM